ncbi:uncharacterized protein LOC114738847 [Neltuma alba]|uniref:uncharacterized protein LOC114738847 n=1 Tax=Neltuma alba TaxID=207710 RepID=UPI0010A422B9|nr:uncharacterized protein LOC114738847 [Prosopis alba]
MNAFDSPLEALTFNYASFGLSILVNNLWTWLALLTAALSLWKIRTKPRLPPPPPPTPPSNDQSLNGSRSTGDERLVENTVLHEVPEKGPVTAGVFSEGDIDGVTKKKFTIFYEKESKYESEEELTETETEMCCDDGCGFKSEWWEKWDKMLKARMGVNSWYMYQDSTNLNSNVVRFWDSGIGSSRFPKQARYSSSCIVW